MYQRDTSTAKLHIQNEHTEIDRKLSSGLAVINVRGSHDQISSWRGPLNYGQGTHPYICEEKSIVHPNDINQNQMERGKESLSLTEKKCSTPL